MSNFNIQSQAPFGANNPAGKYAVGKYQELKQKVMEEGVKLPAPGPPKEIVDLVGTLPSERIKSHREDVFINNGSIDLGNGTLITRARVDNNPKTDDSIQTMREEKGEDLKNQGISSKVIMEKFREKYHWDTPVITFNYLEVINFIDGTQMSSNLFDHFNANTGQKMHMPYGD